jgi:hypothetical protein
VSADGLEQAEIASIPLRGGILSTEPSLSAETSAGRNKIYGWNIHSRGGHEDANPLRPVEELATYPGALKLEFTP